jgi:hypothetical protein
MVHQLAEGAKPAALQLAGKPIPLAELLQILKVTGHAQDDMRWNDNPRLVLELYGLRLTQPFVDAGELLRKISQLEKGGANAPETTNPVAPSFARPSPVTPSIARPNPMERPAVVAMPAVNSAPKSNPEPASVSSRPDSGSAPSGDTNAQWKQLLAEMWKKPLVGAQLERARLQGATEKEWVIAFPDRFGLDTVQRSHGLLLETLMKIVGRPMGARLTQMDRPPKEEVDPVVSIPSPDERVEERQPVVLKDAGVQKILQTFKGRIRESDDEA